jgi:hypothetical protein
MREGFTLGAIFGLILGYGLCDYVHAKVQLKDLLKKLREKK